MHSGKNDLKQFYGSIPTRPDDVNSDDVTLQFGFHGEEGESASIFPSPPLCRTFLESDFASIAANMMNALLGVGIFAVPWGFSQSGVLGGISVTFFVAYLSHETSWALLHTQKTLYEQTGKVQGYPEIASILLGGEHWISIVKVATVISSMGGCIGYLIFLGQICNQLLQVTLTQSIIISLVPLVLLSWIRSFRELTLFTVFGNFSIIFAVFSVFFCGWSNLTDKTVLSTPLLIPNILNYLGPITFMFTIQYCVLSIGAESLSAQEKHSTNSLSSTPSFPSLALLSFSSTTATTTTDNKAVPAPAPVKSLPSSKSSSITAAAAAGAAAAQVQMEADGVGMSLSAAHRLSVSSLSGPVGCAYVSSGLLIALHGATGFTQYRNTEYVVNRWGQTEAGCEERVCQNVVLNLPEGPLRAVVIMALFVAIISSFIVFIAPAREHIENEALRRLGPTSEVSIMTTKNVVRTSLVLLAGVVAIRFPYFGTVLGRVGGLTDAFQAFVLPPMIYMRLDGQLGGDMMGTGMGWWSRMFYRAILVWGLCTIAYTVGQIVLEIVE